MDIYKTHEEIYNLIKPDLSELGFQFSEYRPDFCSLRFKNINEDVTKYIRLQFYNDSLGLNELEGYIVSNQVNKILERFVGAMDGLEIVTLKDYSNSEANQNNVRALYNKKQDKSSYAANILNHITSSIIPFSIKYPDMDTINEEILNKVHEEDYPKWFHGNSTSKILIILKLCNNPKYEDYKKKRKKVFLKFVEQNPTMWKSVHLEFLALIDYLDSEKYKEVLV